MATGRAGTFQTTKAVQLRQRHESISKHGCLLQMPWQHSRQQRREQKNSLPPVLSAKWTNHTVGCLPSRLWLPMRQQRLFLIVFSTQNITLLSPNTPAGHVVRYKHINCQLRLYISDDVSRQYALESKNSISKVARGMASRGLSDLTAAKVTISFSSSGAGNPLQLMKCAKQEPIR